MLIISGLDASDFFEGYFCNLKNRRECFIVLFPVAFFQLENII